MRRWAGLLLLVAPLGWAQSFRLVSVDDLYRALSDPKTFVIDVRTPQEFAQGHVPGAVNWPLQEIDRWWSRVPKNRVVYIKCNTQNRSRLAVQYLLGKGYTGLNLVQGGIQAWLARRYPVER
ncbi:MAG: rhodanese-like domain-containing protein [Meiothermus sp.]|uniref:rhodanese-like domain-containing protein n=1 Tax=Meiothermus sp. TaxID=1955249 RepID=UPI0025F731E3|nr:rhodanese-like domain-containing protein [Meiothermus sp.]MCS7058833.1 rhodanese-like domain-containing protein [Meiothermus sp.]MCS7194067.1 rhodanese-like domain-containing protein [Meiothermus sp.]MCX7740438.1 rhodanese-like domain-containing protein [Meiothermus sp.]MDW8091158.1 rhodanese-like domain-containing protein [Meiothermus sp.]MDW8480466.1 rhodanese-like domain-containing protein [Meiothermus sp.]